MRTYRTALWLVACLLLAACSRAPSVYAGGETLIGKSVEDGRVAAFLGIPFAEPPVGALRWRAPQPLSDKRRLAEREVTEFAPACMQSMRILDWYRYIAELFGDSADYYDDLTVSEDCLYLNVWTPTPDVDAKLPVMVWIHGGSNKSGWSYELPYHGHKLAPKGVVVVSVAYRQGVFGFFSHPDMPADEPLANFAYWDLIAAFEWLQQNIDQFGGDPARITLFGESAGAQNVLALMFSDRANTLFHRAVIQSTARFGLSGMSTLEAEQQRALELAEALKLDPADLDALRELPAGQLLQVYEETFSDYYHSPAVDHQLFQRRIWDSVQAGNFPDIPLIAGTNDHEWYDSLDDDIDWPAVRARAVELTRMDGNQALAIVEAEESDPQRALDRLITANNYVCPAQHLAVRMTTAGKSAWVYHFTRVREDPAGDELGAFHGAEYAYVFGTHDRYMTTNATDLALQQAMQRYWIDFAKSGNPNSAAAPSWPQFTAADKQVQELGDTVFTKEAPEQKLCALFETWHASSAWAGAAN